MAPPPGDDWSWIGPGSFVACNVIIDGYAVEWWGESYNAPQLLTPNNSVDRVIRLYPDVDPESSRFGLYCAGEAWAPGYMPRAFTVSVGGVEVLSVSGLTWDRDEWKWWAI
jgi:hypothetical protein